MDPFHIAVLAMTIAVLPLLFIPSFKGLSWLSLIGCCSTVVVVVTVALVVAFDPLRTHMPQQVSKGGGMLQAHAIAKCKIVQSVCHLSQAIANISKHPESAQMFSHNRPYPTQPLPAPGQVLLNLCLAVTVLSSSLRVRLTAPTHTTNVKAGCSCWWCAVQPPPRHELLRMGIIQAAGIFAVSVSGGQQQKYVRVYCHEFSQSTLAVLQWPEVPYACVAMGLTVLTCEVFCRSLKSAGPEEQYA